MPFKCGIYTLTIAILNYDNDIIMTIIIKKTKKTKIKKTDVIS